MTTDTRARRWRSDDGSRRDDDKRKMDDKQTNRRQYQEQETSTNNETREGNDTSKLRQQDEEHECRGYARDGLQALITSYNIPGQLHCRHASGELWWGACRIGQRDGESVAFALHGMAWPDPAASLAVVMLLRQSALASSVSTASRLLQVLCSLLCRSPSAAVDTSMIAPHGLIGDRSDEMRHAVQCCAFRC